MNIYILPHFLIIFILLYLYSRDFVQDPVLTLDLGLGSSYFIYWYGCLG